MSDNRFDLKTLDVLSLFKRRMIQVDQGVNISPFADCVTTALSNVEIGELESLQADIRQRIESTIELVRAGSKKSEIILIAGAAGTGKTYLLRKFQSKERMDRLGYVYVGGSNHWKVDEFQARLLDWMIEALTRPTPSGDHLLLQRIQAIGFRATEQLLDSPVSWKNYLVRQRRRWFSRWRRPSFEQLQELVKKRDPKLFRHLDFARFSNYVCDRFLADPANLTHRFALRVLLCYLFPDPEEGGIGTRERVLHWFRQRVEQDYFVDRLGASECLDTQYSIIEAIKLLTHLFSTAVSDELSTANAPCPARVFLIAFDQVEGRNELFDSVREWNIFFAHLSELYNTLPNLVILFTMTLGLRTELHSSMERQFRDRIRMDDHFVLRFPEDTESLKLYRSRIQAWLSDDPILRQHYNDLNNPLIPFSEQQIYDIASLQPIRAVLQSFDKAFHKEMAQLVIEPDYDYLYNLNEYRQSLEIGNEHEFSAQHLQTAYDVLSGIRNLLPSLSSMRLTGIDLSQEKGVDRLFVEFRAAENESTWVRVYIVRLGHRNVQTQVDNAMDLLANKSTSQYALWMIRHTVKEVEIEKHRKDQVFPRGDLGNVECRLRALLDVLKRREDYQKNQHWNKAVEVVGERLDQTYLGELLRDARTRLANRSWPLPELADFNSSSPGSK